jgi:molybdopterin-binding protein
MMRDNGLAVGRRAYGVIKASSVMIGVDEKP